MLYMIIEQFKNCDPGPVYRRFRDKGRLAPENLKYVASWVTSDLAKCFQLMECDDVNVLKEWTEKWNDLVDFEVVPVVTSDEAAKLINGQL